MSLIRYKNSNIYFKSPQEEKEYPLVLPRLHSILQDMATFFEVHGHQLIITDLLEEVGEGQALNRVSKSHEEGRACDLRVWHLPKPFINKVIEHFNEKYKSISAISSTTGRPTLIVYHDNGNGIHFHVQIRPYKPN